MSAKKLTAEEVAALMMRKLTGKLNLRLGGLTIATVRKGGWQFDKHLLAFCGIHETEDGFEWWTND